MGNELTEKRKQWKATAAVDGYAGGPKTKEGRKLDKLPQGAALSEAVVICGSKSELARRLGVPRGNVSEWFRNGGVPSKYAMQINRLLGIDLVWLLQRFAPYKPEGDGARGGVGRQKGRPVED